MPLVKRCCICGRIADNPHEARPYKKGGYACDICYTEKVLASKKWKAEKYYKYAD